MAARSINRPDGGGSTAAGFDGVLVAVEHRRPEVLLVCSDREAVVGNTSFRAERGDLALKLRMGRRGAADLGEND